MAVGHQAAAFQPRLPTASQLTAWASCAVLPLEAGLTFKDLPEKGHRCEEDKPQKAPPPCSLCTCRSADISSLPSRKEPGRQETRPWPPSSVTS